MRTKLKLMRTIHDLSSYASAMADEEVVSLQDVLEEDRQLEQDANAVLGDSDDAECTYPKGYARRQAVYACATCLGTGELAGICLACSLHCHDGHQLYELYTKRHFRCDCGNSKFPGFACSLFPGKEAVNARNQYNHNFQGLYCTCKRPYPDSDDEEEDVMLQCSVCEDWFHSRHLGGALPISYSEMVCDACMKSCDFLRVYQLQPEPVRVGRGEEGGSDGVDVTGKLGNLSGGESTEISSSHLPVEESNSAGVKGQGPANCKENAEAGSQRELQSVRGDGEKGGHVDGGGCELMRLRAVLGDWERVRGAGYFDEQWRTRLCRCTSCKELYTSTHTLHLLDEDDTVAAYEARAQARPTTLDAGMAALSSQLDRVQQVEAFHQFNELKSELVDFFKDFAEKKKVVSKRDIEGFFEGMEARKRPRVEEGDGVPPHHCHF